MRITPIYSYNTNSKTKKNYVNNNSLKSAPNFSAALTNSGKVKLTEFYCKEVSKFQAFIESLSLKHSERVWFDVLLSTPGADKNIPAMTSLYDNKPNNAKLVIEFADNLAKDDDHIQLVEKFLKQKNKKGKNIFDVASETKYFDVAADILKLTAKVMPKSILKKRIPEEILKTEKFQEVVDAVIKSEKINKVDTLAFLEKHKDYIEGVNEKVKIVLNYAA